MGHLIFLIIQVFFLCIYVLCKIFDWPGVYAISLFSWFVPVIFYFILTILTLFKKQYEKALIYFEFILLVLCIPNKIWFVYHNVILQFIIVSGFIFSLYKAKLYSFNIYFKLFSCLIIVINSLLLFSSDNFVREKLGASYLYRPYSNGDISWDNFNNTDSIEGGYAAHIEAYMSCRINKVYNYTSATAVATMELDKSVFVSQSGSLLEHEYYHFKITEVVTRKLNKALESNHFAPPTKTQEIISQYLDTLYSMEMKYDTETNHNLNRKMQIEWENIIDSQLMK